MFFVAAFFRKVPLYGIPLFVMKLVAGKAAESPVPPRLAKQVCWRDEDPAFFELYGRRGNPTRDRNEGEGNHQRYRRTRPLLKVQDLQIKTQSL
ncbi:MAG: hypothetical protein A2X67_03570 [Ignavibacteria bacterium GWA2_55_11]|nr:MAG: hypothetical protein A2X67_03570 [Ignavibacteria bacterium GWA2_55_11]